MRFTCGYDGIYSKIYKTMRHRCFISDEYTRTEIKWEWITEKSYYEWKYSRDILFPKNTRGITFLKAMYRAPLWSLEEIEIFRSWFEEYRITCSNMPTKKSLEPYSYASW